MNAEPPVRQAGPGDAAAVARLLHDFNTEFGDPSPGPDALADRLRQLMAGDTRVLLVGEGPDGLALLRFRRALWSEGREAYLAELYVAPDRRGRGLGRALMDAVLELARGEGADTIDLNTSVGDEAARALYESLGFTNREGRPDGPSMLYYEREL